jgi:hypothetical protein
VHLLIATLARCSVVWLLVEMVTGDALLAVTLPIDITSCQHVSMQHAAVHQEKGVVGLTFLIRCAMQHMVKKCKVEAVNNARGPPAPLPVAH